LFSPRLLNDEKMAKMDAHVSGHFAHLWFRWLLGYFAQASKSRRAPAVKCSLLKALIADWISYAQFGLKPGSANQESFTARYFS